MKHILMVRLVSTELPILDTLAFHAQKGSGVIKDQLLFNSIFAEEELTKINMVNRSAKTALVDIIALILEHMNQKPAKSDFTVHNVLLILFLALLDIIQMSLACMNRVNAKNAQLVIFVKEEIILRLVKLDTSVDVEQRLRKVLI